ncbi:hypothetical protein MBLNU13_g00675t2 [Cladosporium sp. NU13]
MPFPFGVSIGDFIVCIDLIKTVVESLQEAHGSASKYRGLVASLESLETALVRVRDVKIHDPVLKQELQHVATKCRNSLSAFLAKVAKYEPSLKLGGSASCIKDSIRKIQWAVYAKEDIAFFQDEISAHMQAIVVLLVAVQSSSIEAVHLHVDQIAVAVVQQQRAESESLQMLIYFGLMHCASEIRNAARTILLANLVLLHALVRYARTGWDLPARVGLGEFSTLEDAFGRLMPIPTQFISDWQIFNTALRHKFAKDFEIPAFARNGRYTLRYFPSYQEVPRGTAFSRVFRPGARLVMTLVIMYDNDRAIGRPSCGMSDNGTAGITQRCPCGSAYTRAKDLVDHILMLPAHSTQYAQPESGNADSSAVSTLGEPPYAQTLEQGEESVFCEDSNHPPILVYDDVRNIKNVDFSTPPMVLITDLWGHSYFVPWSMVQRTDGLMFVLNHFPAGARVLSWEDDYCLMSEKEEEITPANWPQTAYPGMCIRLCLSYKDTGRSLRERFVSKIENELSTFPSTLPRCDPDSVIEHLCLKLGATVSHQELRRLITDTVAALCETKLYAKKKQPATVTANRIYVGSVHFAANSFPQQLS